MATKTAKTTNSERPNNKAWGKHHSPTAEEVKRAQDRSARRAIRKASRPSVVGSGQGINLTMPQVNWQWFVEIMRSRWPNTRKVRAIDSYLALAKSTPASSGGLPMAAEPSLEFRSSSKAASSSRKNGR